MNLKELRIIKSDKRGIMYDCDKLNLISRKKGTINADHTHKDSEILYLIQGEVELTIGDESKVIKAPLKIEIPSDTYHRLIALSDVLLLEDREGE